MLSCETVIDGAMQTEICMAPNGFWWVSPLVIAVSAVVAAFISVSSIRANKEIARKRATLDLIERSESTEYYQDLYRSFTEVRKDPRGLEQLVDVTNPEMVRQRQKVINYFNHYELMAIGIEQGVLDEGVYKSFMRSTLVRDWFEASAFIAHLRTPTPDSGAEVSAARAFSKFEALAVKWSPEVQMRLPLETS